MNIKAKEAQLPISNAQIVNIKVSKAKKYIPSIICSILLILIGEILSSGFASMHNISNILNLSSILAIAAIAQTLVVLTGKEGIDLSVGAVMSMGALFGPLFSQGVNSNLWYSFIILAIIGGAVGFLNGFGVQIIGIPPLVVTLIMSSVVNGFTLAYTKGQPSIELPSALLGMGSEAIGSLRWILLISIFLIIMMEYILRKTIYGRSLYLVGNNRNAANLSGINVNKIVILSYILSGIISCWAGMFLVGYTGSAQLEMANDYTLLSIAAVVIGGTKLTGGEGTLLGGALGSIVLVVLTSILIAVGVPAGVRQLIQGLTLLVILVIYSRSPKLRQ